SSTIIRMMPGSLMMRFGVRYGSSDMTAFLIHEIDCRHYREVLPRHPGTFEESGPIARQLRPTGDQLTEGDRLGPIEDTFVRGNDEVACHGLRGCVRLHHAVRPPDEFGVDLTCGGVM